MSDSAVDDPIDPRGDQRWGTLPALVADAARRFGDAEALVDAHGPSGVTTRWSFTELAERIDVSARAAMAAGVEVGDRVAIWAPNCAEWVVAALGAVSAGGVLVPLNTRYRGAEAAYILGASGAKVLFTVQGFLGTDYPEMLASTGADLADLELVVVLRSDGDRAMTPSVLGVPVMRWDAYVDQGNRIQPAALEARATTVGPNDISDLVFTSGTTGQPKGVMTTHSQTLRTFAMWATVVGLVESDRYLIVNPFFHTFGYKAGVVACLMTGATMVAEPVFDVDVLLQRIDAEQISVLPGPPTIFQSILDHPGRADVDLSTLRLVVTGAAVVPVALVEALWAELGIETVLTAYGLTEATGTVTMCRRGDSAAVIAGTSGRAIADVEVRIVGADGTESPRGQPGEVVVRGYNVMSGYFGQDEATAEVIDPDGWLHTGDIGTMDAAGNVTITDRLKDMYVSGGFNVYPAEVEAVLRRHPSVAQVAVVGVPDDRMGEVGVAVVVVAPGADAADVIDHLPTLAKEHLANFKIPRRVDVVEALPVNASGKVLKRQLRDERS